MATNKSEEIIERKEGSPLATSCLILAFVAILGAISLQVAEITEIRAKWKTGEERRQNRVIHVGEDKDKLLARIDGILGKSKPTNTEEAKEIIKEGKEMVKEARAIASGEELKEKEDSAEPEEDSPDEEPPAEEEATPEEAAPEEDAPEDSELEDF